MLYIPFIPQHLWRLVVEEAGLIKQLYTLKDYFLLGRGELFLAFIDQSQALLSAPPMKHTEHGEWFRLRLAVPLYGRHLRKWRTESKD